MQLVILGSKPLLYLCSLNLEEQIQVSLPPRVDQQTAQTNLSKTAYLIVATIYAVRQSTRSGRRCSFPVPVRAPKCGGFCLFYEESLLKSWGFDARR